ncbi:sigma-54-dependent transcriptional regulator [Candidatus Hydrogenedentota bacterium]
MTPTEATILVIDDDEGILEVLRDRLEAEGHQVLTASNGEDGLELIAAESPDLILLDLQMPGMDGIDVLHSMREKRLDATVLVMTAFATIDKTVQAMRAGAYDFIPKPFEPDHVKLVIQKALERDRLRRENEYLHVEIESRYHGIIGESPAMKEVMETARRAAASKATMLLLGESGVGKEVFARAIHKWSPRSEQPFVTVNCVAIPDQLLESELFGHEKGSFTGAYHQKKGKFELANTGTVLLDEIGVIPGTLQAKLLRVLQESEFERVGGLRPIKADVRVIAATNRDLEADVRNGLFRDDLYYRLNVVSLTLPPLRERKEDLTLLVEHFIRRYCDEMKREKLNCSKEVLDILIEYDWPGNVRELQNVIERAVVLGDGKNIRPQDLPSQIVLNQDIMTTEGGRGFHISIREYKRALIRDTLAQCGGNQTRAAEKLGLQRTYLARLIKNLGVSPRKQLE